MMEMGSPLKQEWKGVSLRQKNTNFSKKILKKSSTIELFDRVEENIARSRSFQSNQNKRSRPSNTNTS
jgi:CTD small phosphatase-like protein 2